MRLGGGHKNFKPFFKYKKYVATDMVRTPFVDEIADTTDLKYEDNSFDIVLCLNVLEHIPNFQDAIKGCVRVAKEKVLFLTPFAFPLHDRPQDFWRITEYAYIEMLKGFKTKIKAIGWKRFPFFYFVEVDKK